MNPINLEMNKTSILKKCALRCALSGAMLTLTLACSSGNTDDNASTGPQHNLEPSSGPKVTAKAEEVQESIADEQLVRSSLVANSVQRRFRGNYGPVENTEKYQHYIENGVRAVQEHPVSTFSIDVDTGSYTNSRRMINQGMLPPADAVRIEEFINYFDYQYLTSGNSEGGADAPFSIDTALAPSPWAKGRHLMRIALKGVSPELTAMQGRNLVFLLDVSGSMNQPKKLPLLTRSLELLTSQLTERDRVSIVVYAGASGVVLEPTPGHKSAKIKQALNQLAAGGSTNGEAGIELAYNMAEQSFIADGVNRVILATDGDFNVGISNHDQLLRLIKNKRQRGIALTTLGFGQGNYNDHLMEQLADAGNGNYAYIDTINEARKVLIDQMDATLSTIAKDVKIQVEFNPELVAEYRLIGYENRILKREDFNNDNVDAGEIGAGHTVTAFYELTLAESQNKFLEPLRYQQPKPLSSNKRPDSQLSNELAWVKLRYKPISSKKSRLLTQSVLTEQIVDFDQQSADFRFASSVVAFAHLLKGSHYWQEMDYQQIIDMAVNAKGQDSFGYRAEFINLVRTSASLQTAKLNQSQVQPQPVELNIQGFTRNIVPKPTLLTSH